MKASDLERLKREVDNLCNQAADIMDEFTEKLSKYNPPDIEWASLSPLALRIIQTKKKLNSIIDGSNEKDKTIALNPGEILEVHDISHDRILTVQSTINDYWAVMSEYVPVVVIPEQLSNEDSLHQQEKWFDESNRT